MNTVSLVSLLIVSVVLIVFSMLFSISESSFLGVNRLRLRILRDKNDKRAIRVSKLLEKKEILINTLLVANEIVNILLSSIITAVAMMLFGNKGVGIATFAVTLFLLVFGEITPKTLSTRNPDGIAFALSGFVQAVVFLLKPLVLLLTIISRIFLRFRGIKIEKPKQSYSEEDIKTFIEVGAETGVLEKGENAIMNRVFTFSDLEAKDIMIPRVSVIAIKVDASYKEILELSQRTRISYFPVYKDNLDEIVGVLYLRDLLKYIGDDFNLSNIMRNPLFIPGTMKISSVQHVMRENNESIGIVIDEYSGTDGVITKEDIIREIFGTDEVSKPWREAKTNLDINELNEVLLSGSTLLSDLMSTGMKLKSNVNETLGGWVTEQLGHIPVVAESFIKGGYEFEVVSMVIRRVETVKISKLNEEENNE